MSDDKLPPRRPPEPRRRGLRGSLDRLAFRFFGAAERQPDSSPVVRRHDPVDNEIDSQIAAIEVATDADGHHYGLQRHEFRPVNGLQGNTYPYYAHRPPLNAPET